MQQYANVTCSKCFGVFPGNVMRSISDRVVVGHTEKRHAGTLESYGSETQYGYERGVLCPSCFGKRRRNGCIGLLVLIGGASALIWLAFQHGDRRQLSSSPVSNQVELSDVELDAPSEPETGEGEFSDEAPDTEKSVVKDEDVLPVDDGDAGRAETANEPDPGQEEISFRHPTIMDATLESLTTGKAIKWSSEGRSGFVVVSGATAGPVPCRNVYFTVKERGEERQSDTKTYCESSPGNWTVRE